MTEELPEVIKEIIRANINKEYSERLIKNYSIENKLNSVKVEKLATEYALDFIYSDEYNDDNERLPYVDFENETENRLHELEEEIKSTLIMFYETLIKR